jgi:hypothetical protein
MGGTFGRMPQARYARLSAAATHPAGARPNKCIIIIVTDGGQSPLDNNNNIYLVRPARGGGLHRGPHLSVAVMPTGPLGSLTACKLHALPKCSNRVGTIRGSFETMPAGPDRIPAVETRPPAIISYIG